VAKYRLQAAKTVANNFEGDDMENNLGIEGGVYGEKEAGVYLGGEAEPVSPRTMQRWRLEGVGPEFLKLGRLVRYRKSDLDRWCDAQLRSSTSQIRR
jgi:hypothetical protein